MDTAAETIPAAATADRTNRESDQLCCWARTPAELRAGRTSWSRNCRRKCPPGLPSALLERRPDIRAAEQNLIAANANIGVAKAAYFPQISLSGLLGGQSTQLSSLFSGPHSAWNFVPQVSQPIFTAGRLKSGVRLARSRSGTSALIQYREERFRPRSPKFRTR